ncbi:MAG: hypothetical protein HY905_16035 [Deltaproteobacteria bacterium]|nr:hypothetical protein [Deltaproteobacteria bacterium]
MPVQTTLRRVGDWPDALELIESQADQLSEVCPDLVRCHVVVDRGRRGRHSRYDVRVLVTAAGACMSVERATGRGARSADLLAAIADAFDASRRMLVEHMDRRGSVRRFAFPLPALPPTSTCASV